MTTDTATRTTVRYAVEAKTPSSGGWIEMSGFSGETWEEAVAGYTSLVKHADAARIIKVETTMTVTETDVTP